MANRAQTTLIVKIDLDNIPGWGYYSEDHLKLVQKFLDDSIGHYHPTVTIQSGRNETNDDFLYCMLCGKRIDCYRFCDSCYNSVMDSIEGDY